MEVQLFNGDCISVMNSLIEQGVKVDAIITDPPYATTLADCDKLVPFDKMWDCLKKLRKDKCPIVLFGNEPFSSKLRLSNISEFKYDWVWSKSKAGSAFTAKYRPLAKHETMSVFGKGAVNYYPQMEEGEPYKRVHRSNMADKANNHKVGLNDKDFVHVNDGKRYPGTVIFFPSKWRKQDQVHPHQKPIELMEYLINTYSLEGDTILDFTSGSCTTGLACLNTNRNFIGIEIREDYFNIGVERLKTQIESNNLDVNFNIVVDK